MLVSGGVSCQTIVIGSSFQYMASLGFTMNQITYNPCRANYTAATVPWVVATSTQAQDTVSMYQYIYK